MNQDQLDRILDDSAQLLERMGVSIDRAELDSAMEILELTEFSTRPSFYSSSRDQIIFTRSADEPSITEEELAKESAEAVAEMNAGGNGLSGFNSESFRRFEEMVDGLPDKMWFERPNFDDIDESRRAFEMVEEREDFLEEAFDRKADEWLFWADKYRRAVESVDLESIQEELDLKLDDGPNDAERSFLYSCLGDQREGELADVVDDHIPGSLAREADINYEDMGIFLDELGELRGEISLYSRKMDEVEDSLERMLEREYELMKYENDAYFETAVAILASSVIDGSLEGLKDRTDELTQNLRPNYSEDVVDAVNFLVEHVPDEAENSYEGIAIAAGEYYRKKHYSGR